MRRYLLATAVLALPLAVPALEIPRASPAASVAQTVGITRIAIEYHRPGVKDRVIWGDLVPWDQVWRLGANDATTISFTDPVTIAGTEVPAGTYALFAIPGKERWSFVLNRAAKQWGAFSHDPAQDVLRATATPEPAPHTEWMTFAITPRGEDQAEVEVRWEKLRVAFPIAVKVRELTWARIDEALKGEPDAATLARAASYAAATGERAKPALGWIEKAIAAERSAFRVETRARLLHLDGRTPEAIAEMTEARKLGEGKLPPEYFRRVDAALAEWRAQAR